MDNRQVRENPVRPAGASGASASENPARPPAPATPSHPPAPATPAAPSHPPAPATPAHPPAPAGASAASQDPSFAGVLAPGDGVLAGPAVLTRREFAAAAAATMAAALAGPAAARADALDPDAAPDPDPASDADADPNAALDPDPDPDPDPASDIVTVDEDGNVHILNTFADLIDETFYQPTLTFTLPLGCNVYADCETRAAVVQANAGARPFTVVGCLDYASGAYTVVLPQPVGGASFAPSEARCTEQLMAWVEVDNATDDWAFYAVPFAGQQIGVGTPGVVKLGEGDAEWLPPQFAVEGSTVVWQVMPDPAGSHTTSYSHAYRWTLGEPAGTEVWESPGRFACAPDISAGILTIAPRVKPDEGVYYAITALDLYHDLRQIDQLIMPASVKPFFATRIGNVFAFSVEANYGYGGLLGTMGYYIGPGAGPFDYVAREPSAQISYVAGRYIVKSRLMYFVIDPVGQSYARIGSVNGCVDYGDYPATSGTVGQFVTYAAVKDSTTGVPNGVIVRIFTLI